KTGDIIVKVEGNPVYESSDLQERVGRLQPGDKINLTVLRDGSEKNFTVTLKADAPAPRTAAVSKSASELFNKMGASFQPLNQAQKAKFHVNSGVLVTQVRPGGIFDDTEIPVGSIITSINKQPINSVADMDKVITNLRNGRLIITGYYPDGGSFSNVFEVQ
ncbi:MAG: PDZ domain-containing protein, partial [Mucilaginibacter sp.]|uniref:PDZ domain-containing protein n=1 Tax=Mucilaginibacter sp. TaxID=1882438 RepID=UPI003562E5A9